MIGCVDVQAFADGELGPPAAKEFRVHLRSCEACQTSLIQILELSARLSTPRKDCKHERRARGKDIPLVYGSHRSQICLDCGAFRRHGHNVDPDSELFPVSGALYEWRPASEYADATAEPEDH